VPSSSRSGGGGGGGQAPPGGGGGGGGGGVPAAPAVERADSVPGPQFKIMLFGCLSPRQRTSRCRRRGRLRVGQPSRGAGHPLYPAARREHPRPHPAAAAVDSTSLVTGDHAPQHLPPAAAASGPSMSGFCRVRHFATHPAQWVFRRKVLAHCGKARAPCWIRATTRPHPSARNAT